MSNFRSRDVIHLMIVLSDNTATNMIIERFGADMVNAYLDPGSAFPTTRAMRKILSRPETASRMCQWRESSRRTRNTGWENRRRAIWSRSWKNWSAAKSSVPRGLKEILAILKQCPDNTGVRRRLGGTPIANKTGALDALRALMSGSSMRKTDPIMIAITVDGMANPDWSPDNAGSLLIADLAKVLVEGLATK